MLHPEHRYLGTKVRDIKVEPEHAVCYRRHIQNKIESTYSRNVNLSFASDTKLTDILGLVTNIPDKG